MKIINIQGMAAFQLLTGVLLSMFFSSSLRAEEDLPGWPSVTSTTKPFAYWWWMGSAVDKANIARELKRYSKAGMGGVHIVPIYGAKGWEADYIPYLSRRWMEMLDFTVTEAKRLGLEVDMTTGSGWCFGGPKVTEEESNVNFKVQTFQIRSGGRIEQKLDPETTQALVAFGPDGKPIDITHSISKSGEVLFSPPGNPTGANGATPPGDWTVYAVTQTSNNRKVKRAAPGGEGWMINPAYPQAMTHYLQWIDEALAGYKGAMPRAQYHDSYEYKNNWSPALFTEFSKRRGYRLQDHLDAFITGKPADRAARVKCDYRETISDMLAESTMRWVKWSHGHGFITRNQAHGSPGNWLDLYAAADIPETEMFHMDRSILVSKFASSAAHVSGKPLVGAETGTWLKEHFTETLADMKYLLDDLFLSGTNHVIYHGTCYSPDEAPWPGWVFYASSQINPRNSIWHDLPALNAYATRCQSILQAGQPDNDILLYWPIHDFWSSGDGMARSMTVHERGWFEKQPIGKTAENLWKAGYQFDYISDRLLATAKAGPQGFSVGGIHYKAIVVPSCDMMPLETFSKLMELAENSAAPIVFVGKLPDDAPGLNRHSEDFHDMRKALGEVPTMGEDQGIRIGPGTEKARVKSIEASLKTAGCLPEAMTKHDGIVCIRRKLPDGCYYFIANRGRNPLDNWIPLATRAESVVRMDPMTGGIGLATSRRNANHQIEVNLNLPPGASVILRVFANRIVEAPVLPEYEPAGESVMPGGRWQVEFTSGGPVLPAPFATDRLGSWTDSGQADTTNFAGTAVHRLKFDMPGKGGTQFLLDLGKVCQSARVILNGKDYGTCFTPPFRMVVDNLKAMDNLLEVEVTSTCANRIRDMDQRGVKWHEFHDIRFVSLDYKKFDASHWPLADVGLLGPMTLTPVKGKIR